MRSLIRPIQSAAMSRTMSSHAPGPVLTGTHWNYRITDIVPGDNTHSSFAFKAVVIPHENTLNTPRWFVAMYHPSS